MGADLVTAVAIEAKTRAGGLAVRIFGTDDFHEALEAAEERGCIVAQVDQDLVVDQWLGDMINDDRGDRR